VSGDTDGLLEQIRRGLRASRDRRGERDAEFIRQLAGEGLMACDRIEAALESSQRVADGYANALADRGLL
jgi:hypothetical protein